MFQALLMLPNQGEFNTSMYPLIVHGVVNRNWRLGKKVLLKHAIILDSWIKACCEEWTN